MIKSALAGIAAIVMAIGIIGAVVRDAEAVPTLQLYIENSTYNPATESWEFTGNDVRLWVLGVTETSAISTVRLTASFPSTETGTISLTPTTADPSLLPPALPGYATADDSTPPPAPVDGTPSSATSSSGSCGPNGTDGTIPCMGNGTPIPNHGQFGTGNSWVEFALGDFNLTDSPIGDYISTIPDPSNPASFPKRGQINAYDVSLSGFSDGVTIHFDAFNHVVMGEHKIRYRFAPFSHDAALGGEPVPEPSTLLLVGSVLTIAGAWMRRRSPR